MKKCILFLGVSLLASIGHAKTISVQVVEESPSRYGDGINHPLTTKQTSINNLGLISMYGGGFVEIKCVDEDRDVQGLTSEAMKSGGRAPFFFLLDQRWFLEPLFMETSHKVSTRFHALTFQKDFLNELCNLNTTESAV